MMIDVKADVYRIISTGTHSEKTLVRMGDVKQEIADTCLERELQMYLAELKNVGASPQQCRRLLEHYLKQDSTTEFENRIKVRVGERIRSAKRNKKLLFPSGVLDGVHRVAIQGTAGATARLDAAHMNKRSSHADRCSLKNAQQFLLAAVRGTDSVIEPLLEDKVPQYMDVADPKRREKAERIRRMLND